MTLLTNQRDLIGEIVISVVDLPDLMGCPTHSILEIYVVLFSLHLHYKRNLVYVQVQNEYFYLRDQGVL